MIRLILFIVCTILFVRISRQALKNPRSHGFYRFFVFEGVTLLILLNNPYWFSDPFSPTHIFSWTLLAFSLVFVILSIKALRQKGGYANRADMPENFAFENTTTIVEAGLYRYVRHPMYSSLLFLAWGAFLKHVTFINVFLVLGVSGLLVVAAKIEERENVYFFGNDYKRYMRCTKMFIPWLV